MKSFKCTCRMY